MTSTSDAHVLAYLGLGSNLGDREANIRNALERLAALDGVEVLRVSSMLETEPAYVLDQPDFINACAAVSVPFGAAELLSHLLAIEADMGRVRVVDKGPRLIDLDILLFGDEIVDSDELSIPHPAIGERFFVLAPLAEIAANVVHPVTKVTISAMLHNLKV
ncbi:MAG: 2-amino-4-hydroxy-6-hydroxymethyldihydropteridine diphosphokinase [bacterium]